MDVWVSGKLAYVPIAKNASTTFTVMCQNLGWHRMWLKELGGKYRMFGHFQHPLERHIKGTAMFLKNQGLTHMLDDYHWQKIWSRAVMDLHSYPVTWSLGRKAFKMDWIPILPGSDVTNATRQYLANHKIKVGDIPRLNDSTAWMEKLYQRLREIREEHDMDGTLQHFYSADMELWYNIVRGVSRNNPWYSPLTKDI